MYERFQDPERSIRGVFQLFRKSGNAIKERTKIHNFSNNKQRKF